MVISHHKQDENLKEVYNVQVYLTLLISYNMDL